MTTYVRAPEAARRLGVTLPTLYAYVSRGRVGRTKAPDGKASLFDLDEIEALRERSRRVPQAPPTIDVQVTTAVTQLDEDGVRYRGRRVDTLVDRPFEQVAELLWTGRLPTTDIPPWPSPAHDPTGDAPTIVDLIALATGLARAAPPDEDAPSAARRLLAAIPATFGVTTSSGAPYADRVTRLWLPDPAPAVVDAVNAILVLLADHELATSTLAVRVAASVRSSPLLAIVAGLATVEGALHGSAAAYAHRFLEEAESTEPDTLIRRHLADRRRLPGFGHKIYRRRDPRFDLLLDRVRRLPDAADRLDVVDAVVRTAGARIAQAPNVDLALGALSFVAGLPADTPLFAIARIAGWTAHYLEEIEEAPVRFRGLARQVVDR